MVFVHATFHRVFADVAQPVEQLIRNQQVSGSIPLVGSKNKGFQVVLPETFFIAFSLLQNYLILF